MTEGSGSKSTPGFDDLDRKRRRGGVSELSDKAANILLAPYSPGTPPSFLAIA